jgi:hypothetical protein
MRSWNWRALNTSLFLVLVLKWFGSLALIACLAFRCLDDILATLRLSPEDIEIPIPGYYRRENQLALREREKLLDTLGTTTFDPRTAAPRIQTSLTVEQAIQIIQVSVWFFVWVVLFF